MNVKRYTVSEAKKNLSKLILEAERGEDVYITRAGKPMMKVAPLAVDKERKPGGFAGKISWTPDALDLLTDEEMKDLGFE